MFEDQRGPGVARRRLQAAEPRGLRFVRDRKLWALEPRRSGERFRRKAQARLPDEVRQQLLDGDLQWQASRSG
jgi:hypothetical protein